MKKHGTSATAVKVAVAFFAGFVVFLLLLPVRRFDTDPPLCFSVFGYTVPCGAGLSVAAGAATAGVAGLAFWLKSRRR